MGWIVILNEVKDLSQNDPLPNFSECAGFFCRVIILDSTNETYFQVDSEDVFVMALSEQILPTRQFHASFAAKNLGNPFPLAIFSLPTRPHQHLSTSYAQFCVVSAFSSII